MPIVSQMVQACTLTVRVADLLRLNAVVHAQAHEDRNLARKLTPAEKKEKKHQKLMGQADETDAPTVNVYCVRSLADPRHRFKVRVNADVSPSPALLRIMNGVMDP